MSERRIMAALALTLAALLVPSPGARAGSITEDDIAAAVGEQERENATTAFLGQAAKKVMTKGKDKLVADLQSQAEAWINAKLDALPPSARRTVLRDTLDYIRNNQGDLDGLMKAGLKGDSNEVLAKTGGLFANALTAATARLEDSQDPALRKLFSAGKGIQDLIAPVEQLSKGMGHLVEGNYKDAGKEFALAIPGVKATHDRVVAIVELERQAFHWLQDQGQESIYQVFQKGGYTSKKDLELLIDASAASKGLLRNLQLRFGWKSQEEALRNLHRGFLARAQAERAAAEQAKRDRRVLEYAWKYGLLMLPDPLPPAGPARTAALRESLAHYRALGKGLIQRLEAASGVPRQQWRGNGNIFRLQQLMKRQQEALRDGKWLEARRLRVRIQAELAARARELEEDAARSRGEDPCDDVAPSIQEEMDRELRAAGRDQVASLLRRKLGDDSQRMLNCICRVHSGAAIGVGTRYEPGGDGCGGAKGGPCVSRGFGCWRRPLKADTKALAACRTSRELARELCREAKR